MWQFTGKKRPSFAEDPKPGQESVWDYPRPPICRADKRRITVTLNQRLIADTRQAIRVLETASPPTIYIPPEDINMAVLQKTAGSSFCEWKGAAVYWSLQTPEAHIKNVAWSYDPINSRFAEIEGFLCFYPGKIACAIDDEPVQPQAGGFYGGWVTQEIVGPWKGPPGTGGW